MHRSTLPPSAARASAIHTSAQADGSGEPLLRVEDLNVHFRTAAGRVRAVDGVSLHVDRGEIVGLVGESGSGKSTVGLSLMRLLPAGVGEISSGRILLNGTDLIGLTSDQMRRIRGNEVSMTFQDPMTYLNPVLRVGDQITEGSACINGSAMTRPAVSPWSGSPTCSSRSRSGCSAPTPSNYLVGCGNASSWRSRCPPNQAC